MSQINPVVKVVSCTRNSTAPPPSGIPGICTHINMVACVPLLLLTCDYYQGHVWPTSDSRMYRLTVINS